MVVLGGGLFLMSEVPLEQVPVSAYVGSSKNVKDLNVGLDLGAEDHTRGGP